jgi:predicted nucleotidyltransferase component of viral defense system
MITFDSSFREQVLLKPQIRTIGYNMDVIPVFEVLVMDANEIAAEKMRALMTRVSARDLYDLVFLARFGAKFDRKLIEKKLGYYGLGYDRAKIIRSARKEKGIWLSELQSLVKNVPDFGDYIGELEKQLP